MANKYNTYLYGNVFSEIELDTAGAPTPGTTGSNSAAITANANKIGRASCRERV